MTKMPPWSFSHLTAYKQCPRKYHHLYVLKDIPFEESPEMTRGKDVHKAMELRINEGKALPQEMQAYEQFIPNGYDIRGETKLGILVDGTPCDFFAPAVWGRGVVDCTVRRRVNTTNAMLLDWKTGKRREDPFELAIQAVLVRAANPELQTIIGYYVWLGERSLGMQHDVSATVSCLAHLVELAGNIERSLEMDYLPPKQSPLCKWCRVKNCEFNTNDRA